MQNIGHIVRVKNKSHVDIVAKLAREIWEQHFTPIIGAAQVEYMLEKFQSSRAISSQLDEGWEYYISIRENDYVGYIALVPGISDGKIQLSKFYVNKPDRGSGAGSQLLHFTEETSRERGFKTVWLTVNRFNTNAIEWYLRRGFLVTDEVKKDIGGGFYMDDFIMEKKMW